MGPVARILSGLTGMSRLAVLVALCLASSHHAAAQTPDASAGPPSKGADNQSLPFNDVILELVADYPAGGRGGYVWPAPRGRHGTSRDLRLGTTRVARKGRGTHCVGITFEVLWRALERQPGGPAGLGLDAAKALRLRALWFVPDDRGEGPAEALPALGLGIAIADFERARPGDFVQMWMNSGNGHSAVFLGWLRDTSGKINGLRYWSSQPWTNGIGVSSHLFGAGRDQVDRSALFIGRALPPRPVGQTAGPASM